MKIAFVVTRSDTVGGVNVHIKDLAIALRERGHEPHILVGGNGPWMQSLHEAQLNVTRIRHLERSVRPITDVRALFELRRALAALKPDIVSTHTAKAGWLGRIAARSLKLPVIFTAHGWTFTEGVPRASAAVWRMAEALVGTLADKIITVSQYDRALAIGGRVAPAEKIITVSNGMPDIPEHLLIRPDQPVPQLVMVARFERQKDHDTLLLALSRLKDLNWNMVLVGGGPREHEMRQLCHELGLDERVRFVGASSRVAEILAQSQIFVLSTHWEGLPRSIIEAMRAGMPVVASLVAGIPELVDDGVNGFLTPARDPDALATRLRLLIESAELRRQMGAQARFRYLQLFHFDRMLARTIAVYHEVIQRRRGGPAGIAAADLHALPAISPVRDPSSS